MKGTDSATEIPPIIIETLQEAHKKTIKEHSDAFMKIKPVDKTLHVHPILSMRNISNMQLDIIAKNHTGQSTRESVLKKKCEQINAEMDLSESVFGIEMLQWANANGFHLLATIPRFVPLILPGTFTSDLKRIIEGAQNLTDLNDTFVDTFEDMFDELTANYKNQLNDAVRALNENQFNGNTVCQLLSITWQAIQEIDIRFAKEQADRVKHHLQAITSDFKKTTGADRPQIEQNLFVHCRFKAVEELAKLNDIASFIFTTIAEISYYVINKKTHGACTEPEE